MQKVFSPSRFVAVALFALLAACAGGSSSFAPSGAGDMLAPAMKPASESPITLDPRKLVVNTLQTAVVLVTEQSTTQKYTTAGSKACRGLVTWSPQKGTTRVFHVKVTAAKKTGSCVITFADANHNTAALPVVVKPEPTSATFSFGGYAENFTVPNGVSSLTIAALGAQGGYAGGGGGLGGGLGGSVTATVGVKAGAVLTIYVGGMGGNYQGTIQGGATQTAGGTGGAIALYGAGACNDGLTGALAVGGLGGGTLNGTQCSSYGGGGGGGGYYGGGGGGAGGAYPGGTYNQGSGGGGSGYAEPSATNVVMASGVRSGSGSVTISWKNP